MHYISFASFISHESRFLQLMHTVSSRPTKHRLDDIVIFSPLSRKQLRSIMQLQMAAISNRLKDRNIEIHLTENGLDHVLAKAYVPEVRFGVV
jgi:ATP-dependent Clp protease ATP-binding subunit ClpB